MTCSFYLKNNISSFILKLYHLKVNAYVVAKYIFVK